MLRMNYLVIKFHDNNFSLEQAIIKVIEELGKDEIGEYDSHTIKNFILVTLLYLTELKYLHKGTRFERESLWAYFVANVSVSFCRDLNNLATYGNGRMIYDLNTEQLTPF